MPEDPAKEKKKKKKSGAQVAGAATTGGLAGSGIVYVMDHWFHVTLSATDGAAIATAISGVGLWVWHTGIKNIGRHIWDGDNLLPAVRQAFRH